MKKLLLKCVLLLILVLGASIVLKTFCYDRLNLLPYSYPSDIIHLKTSYLLKHPEFNTLFIGSSHTLCEANVSLFDSLTDSTLKTKSFNYGIQWLGATELLYFLDKLTNENTLHLKYVFIELTKIKFANFQNINTTRVTHWYNPKDYFNTISISLNSNSSLAFKAASIATHTISLTDHYCNLGYLADVNDFEERDKSAQDSITKLGNSYTGFDAFTGVDTLGIDPKEINRSRIKQTLLFLKDTTGLTMRGKISALEFEKFEKNPELLNNFNAVYLQKLLSVMDALKSKNIYPIFILTPRAERQQYEELLPLFAQLPKENKIQLCDSRKFPEFYLAAYSKDETHLNKRGADIFTKIIANEFNRIMMEKKVQQ